MAATTFYTSPKSELEVRSNIVLKYFLKWSKQLIPIIKRDALEEKFAFIDLCAGWGLNADQTSIVTQILSLSAEKPQIREMLSVVINDKTAEHIAKITGGITGVNMIETFTFPPYINLSNIDDKLLTTLSTLKTLPALALIDAWNYEGLSFDFVANLIHNSRTDCLFILDYQSILAAIKKKKHWEQLIRFFGPKLSTKLQQAFQKKLSPFQKEEFILGVFQQRLKDVMRKDLLLPLQYKFYDTKNKTSHFLFFLTQKKEAYTLMREVFCAESQIIEDGIGNLEYNPNKGLQQKITSQTLFGSMFYLEQELLKTYKSQTLQFIDIYENHHLGKSLVKKNYKDALLNLERKNKITVTRKRHRRMQFNTELSLSDGIFVSFNK